MFAIFSDLSRIIRDLRAIEGVLNCVQVDGKGGRAAQGRACARSTAPKKLWLVFEFVDQDLKRFTKARGKLEPDLVQRLRFRGMITKEANEKMN